MEPHRLHEQLARLGLRPSVPPMTKFGAPDQAQKPYPKRQHSPLKNTRTPCVNRCCWRCGACFKHVFPIHRARLRCCPRATCITCTRMSLHRTCVPLRVTDTLSLGVMSLSIPQHTTVVLLAFLWENSHPLGRSRGVPGWIPCWF